MIAKEEFRRPRKNVGRGRVCPPRSSTRDIPGTGVFDMATPTG